MPTTSTLAPLLTGLGLFFCGVRFIAANLAPLAGPAARRLFRKAVSSTAVASLAGVAAGFATQSTNAVSLIVVGFVRARVLPEGRAVLIPTWSHVGAAALVIMVSLQTNMAVAYALALAGAALYFDFKLSDRFRHGVLVLLGAAMLFLGMETLKVAADPLRTWLVGKGLLVHGQADPLAPLLVGLALAAVTQSSTVAGAIAVALVRVGVFDLSTALVLQAGAAAGSAANYVLLGRKGEAVGRHILLFQAAQKLFGAALLGLMLCIAPESILRAVTGLLGGGPAMAFAWIFLAMQFGGSLACTLVQRPLIRFLVHIAPASATEALGRPANLLDEALAEPSLALDLAAREEQRLLLRLPCMLESLRAEGDREAPSAQTLKTAGLIVAEATRNYLAGVLEGEPSRDTVTRAMRLQRVLDNIVAMHEAVEEFSRMVTTAIETPAAKPLGHLVESLHMLLELLTDITGAEDPSDQQMSLSLLGGREQAMEGLRARLMSAADASLKVQEAVFRSTVLFERVLWLARDTALTVMQTSQDKGASVPPVTATGGLLLGDGVSA